MNYPTLYKLTQTAATQMWRIHTENNQIITEFGHLEGKIQTTVETIKEGKNTGKVNETTAIEQAEAEAQATWTKKLKKGYVQDITAARNKEVDSIIEGGVSPMLAPTKSYPTDINLSKKIVYPAYVQPKLDGIRCVAVIKDGKASLWTRSRKPIHSSPHIIESLEKYYPNETVILDGELYNHEYRDNFEELMSLVRQTKPMPGHENIQYHMYDIVMDAPFSYRNERLKGYTMDCFKLPLAPIPTLLVESLKEALEVQEMYERMGYEGAMIRNADGPYEQGRRSVHLQKMKSFVDDEFEIIGCNDGRGKDEGTAAAFVCLTKEGKEFRVRLKTTYEHRVELFNNPSMWQGKQLTVKYKRFTADGIPYLPIGKAIRDE